MSKLIILILTSTVVGMYASQAPQATEPPKPVDAQQKKAGIDRQLEAAVATPGAAVDPNTFQLGAEDIVAVLVFDEPKFSGGHIVRPDGKITIPLVGEIQAAGLTPNQLSKNITEKLGTVIKDPQVTVSVNQVNSKKYFIQGEVNRPGQFSLVVPTTIMEALSNCGGFHDFANKKKIIILRKGQRLKFNYNEVVKGKKLEQNIYLENGDYIIVQ